MIRLIIGVMIMIAAGGQIEADPPFTGAIMIIIGGVFFVTGLRKITLDE